MQSFRQHLDSYIIFSVQFMRRLLVGAGLSTTPGEQAMRMHSAVLSNELSKHVDVYIAQESRIVYDPIIRSPSSQASKVI